MITAPRTGSMQLCDYLQDDNKNVIAPTTAEMIFPYVWAWKVFVPILVKLGINNKQFHNSGAYGSEDAVCSSTKHGAATNSSFNAT